MASNNRPPLELDDLTQNLKQSSGKGIGAFFPAQPAPLPEQPHKAAPDKEIAAPPTPAAVNPKPPQPAKPPEAVAFDLNIPPVKSETFAFTFEEWLAIDQLKTELTRLLGVDPRVTKIDIMRCALHMLAADYHARGERSFLVDRIKTKKPVDRIRRKIVR